MTLICFAVKEEARFFRPQEQCEMLLTGIGRHNAEKTVRTVLAQQKPRLALSCGFAGGLRPELAAGSGPFSFGRGTPLEGPARGGGGRPSPLSVLGPRGGTARGG